MVTIKIMQSIRVPSCRATLDCWVTSDSHSLLKKRLVKHEI